MGAILGAGLLDPQLLRYNRQIVLPAVGIEGQQQLLQSRVLLIGLGGLGSPVAMYLAACGIGQLALADPDHVELANLQRQILYGTSQVGQSKTEAARQVTEDLNPEISVETIPERLQGDLLQDQVAVADLVVDATDNFESRLEINRVCVDLSTPLVSGAVIRMEGQVAAFRNQQEGDACYQCLFGADPVPEEGCSETGVLGPVAGVIASVQAVEAIKCLLDIGTPLYNRLMVYDAEIARWHVMELMADAQCLICGNNRKQEKPTC